MLGPRTKLELWVAVFVSMVSAPAILLTGRVLGSPVDSALLMGAAFLCTALGGYLGAQQLDAIETTVSTWPGFGVFFGPPLAYLLLAIVVLIEAPFGLLALPWVVVGVMSVVSGLVVVGHGHDVRTSKTIEDARTYAGWEGRAPRNQRRLVLALFAMIGLGTLVSVLVPEIGGSELLDANWILLFLPAVVGGLAAFRNQNVYKITDIGFVTRGTLHSWNNYDGYRIEEDTVVLETASRIGSSLRFDRSDIDDEAAVRDALERVFDTN